MAVNLINSNDIEVEQTGQDIQLKTSTPISTLEGGISDNATNIQNIKDGNVYSTTQEIDTGKTLDGKKIYRSYISFTHSSTGNYTYNHNLGIDSVVSCNAFCTVAGQSISSNGYRPMPYIVSNENYFRIDSIKENTIETTAGAWSNNKVYAWLEYTKVS